MHAQYVFRFHILKFRVLVHGTQNLENWFSWWFVSGVTEFVFWMGKFSMKMSQKRKKRFGQCSGIVLFLLISELIVRCLPRQMALKRCLCGILFLLLFCWVNCSWNQHYNKQMWPWERHKVKYGRVAGNLNQRYGVIVLFIFSLSFHFFSKWDLPWLIWFQYIQQILHLLLINFRTERIDILCSATRSWKPFFSCYSWPMETFLFLLLLIYWKVDGKMF